MLRWFLYVLFALTAGSVVLELESTIFEFSLILRAFATFWKKFFSSSDTKAFCLRIFSFQKKDCMFSQKALLSLLSLLSALLAMLSIPSYIIYYKRFYVSYTFSKIRLSFFEIEFF